MLDELFKMGKRTNKILAKADRWGGGKTDTSNTSTRRPPRAIEQMGPARRALQSRVDHTDSLSVPTR